MRSIAGFTALLFTFATLTACADETARPLKIESRPLPLASGNEAPTTIGKLKHLGTLRLKSDDSDFGGISGLIVSADGKRFLAVTDQSNWLTGELDYSGKKLTAVRGTQIAPLLSLSGKPMSGKEGDSEGLTGAIDGDVYISFERDHRIWRYPFGKSGLTAKPEVVATPAELAKAPDNQGIEAITLLKSGKLLAITEEFLDSDGNFHAWLLNLGSKEHTALKFARRAPFDITDVRQLSDGSVLTLERRFSRVGGVGMQLRRFEQDALKPGAPVDGKVIADASMAYIIDNMEALAVRKGDNGETLIYIASDDNFNAPLQQTLLMLFELED